MNKTRRSLMTAAAAVAALAPGAAMAQRGGRPPPTTAPPLARDPFENNVLKVLEDIDRNQRYLNIDRDDGRLLRIHVESIGAKHVVELGTSTGYSALWMALGAKATGGRLTTYEIDAERAAMARANFKRAGLDDRINVVLGDAHVEVKKQQGPIDLVFIDADKDGYVLYLKALLPLVRPGGLIIADNMIRPAPDPAFVRAITTDPALETVFLSTSTGMALTIKKG
ncbi:MAG: O-methyltransferase [Beijerinckiaceae bacterium]|nr:O-methyltransferase [Beijerinckiaceae bacterium]